MNVGNSDSGSSESPHVRKNSRGGNWGPQKVGQNSIIYFLSFSLLLCAGDMDTVTVSVWQSEITDSGQRTKKGNP